MPAEIKTVQRMPFFSIRMHSNLVCICVRKKKLEESTAAATSCPSSVLGEAVQYSRFTPNEEQHPELHAEQ